MKKLLANTYLIPVLLALFLIIVRYNYNYLVFHTFIEFFSVFVSFSITLVTYYTYSFTKNRYLLFIGLGYFWIGFLDLFHIQTYPGMQIFMIDSPNNTLTFWVLTRTLGAVILLTAPFMRYRTFRNITVSSIFGATALIITYLATMHPLSLYIQGQGLTDLKINFEYFIIAILAVTLYINKKHNQEFSKGIYSAVMLSIVFNILSELSFTLYNDVYGFLNLVGHILKFLSFWVLLQAIIKTSLKEPFTLMQKGASTYDAIPVAAAVVDELGMVRQINHAACEFLSLAEIDIIGKSNHELFHPKNSQKSQCSICQAIEQKKYIEHYESEDTSSGKYIEFSLSPISSSEKNIQGVVQISIDITERKNLQINVQNQFKLLQNIINTLPVRVFWKDTNGKYLGANNLFLQDAKLNSIDEILGKTDLDMVWAKTDAKKYMNDDQEVIKERIAKLQIEEKQTDENGQTIILSTSKVPLVGINDENIGILGIYEDITDTKNMQQQIVQQSKKLHFQATHDELTLLPNRALFQDRLALSIDNAKRNSQDCALLFIDLDEFKEINDSLGHHMGDKVLKIIAQRFKQAIREKDTLARIGGDEFVIIVDDYKNIEALSTLTQKILDTTNKGIDIGEHVLYISASVGISVYPKDSTDAQNLLKCADAAMYKAKDEGKGNYQFYSQEMTQKAMKRISMQSKLRNAIKNEVFDVYFQPQINAQTKEIIGLEALVRWIDENGNMIYPDEFIPFAEETGMIVELDRIVMKKALAQVMQWRNENIFTGSLSLNLAMKQLQKDDFELSISNLISSSKCPPEKIELEITESGLMQKPEESIAKLNRLKELGIKISIDDFGTGYSSLSYIKKLPISKIKIDKSFVVELPDNKDDISIVKAIIALASSLGLKTLAEGVETAQQLEFMLENGCHNIQGYYFAKPMSIEDTTRFLKNFHK